MALPVVAPSRPVGAATAERRTSGSDPAPGRADQPAEPRVVRHFERGTWPLSPPIVVTEFDDPLPYGAGHRGVDLSAYLGQVVVAAGDGTVTTAGPVAGRPRGGRRAHGDPPHHLPAGGATRAGW